MSGTNQEQAIERICRRLHGEMNEQEARQFDLDLQSNPQLAKAYRQVSAMDRALGDFPTLKPSANFTATVLRKTRPVVMPEKERATWLDWIYGLAPAAGLLVIAMIWGRDLWGKAVSEMSHGAGWLDQILGTQWFANQPLILLGALLPVAILGVAYAILHESYGAEA